MERASTVGKIVDEFDALRLQEKGDCELRRTTVGQKLCEELGMEAGKVALMVANHFRDKAQGSHFSELRHVETGQKVEVYTNVEGIDIFSGTREEFIARGGQEIVDQFDKIVKEGEDDEASDSDS